MKRLLSIALITALIVSITPMMGIISGNNDTGVVYAETIPIDEAHFPDESFREFLQREYGNAVDPSAVKELSIVGYYGIKSVEGIEQFTALESLNCSELEISTLDVSHFASLKSLTCYSNKLSSLDVSKNTELEELKCFENHLTSLDVSNNTALTHLNCSWNGISSLDVSNNTSLTVLDCHRNVIESLDVSKNLYLTELNCSSCELSEIDVSNNTALIDFDCGDNKISTLDLSKNPSLQTLDCQATNISSLDLSNNRDLLSLWCRLTNISILNVTNNPSLTDLNCCDNQSLTGLDLSMNPSLTKLDCSNCELLSSLDVSHNLALTELNCDRCKFSVLDVSNNAALEYLSCLYSDITKIYVGEHIPKECYYEDGTEIIYGSSSGHSTHNSFKSDDRTFDGYYGYYYSDSYFSHSAKKYDHSLATMSLCLSFSAYGDTSDSSYNNYDKNVKAVLEGCGFTGTDYKKYKQYSFNEKPTSTSIGCAMGSKQLNDGTTLIAVAVRGGGYESEWSNNLDVGHTGDHYGFNDAATKVCGYISDYIAENEISDNIKIWITGYSRAGATATQAAAKLDRGEVEGISIDNTNVYAYGFATPMGAIKDSNPSNHLYDNIFSIIHYHDIVPLVAPEKWGFGRYGKTYIFPYKTSTLESNMYESGMVAYLKNMGCQYELYNFTTSDGSNDSLGLFMRKFVDSFARNTGLIVPNAATGRIGYRLKYQSDFQTALGSGLLGGDNLELGLGLAALVSENHLDKRYTNLLLKEAGLNPRLTATAIANYKLLAKAHADQRYYIAWMQSMDENYVSDAHCRFMSGNGRVIKIKCPVDVHVTDNEGNLVATIIDEKPWQDEEASVIASMDENGQKTVYLPIDAEYSITVTAREDCDVIYTVEETTASSLEPVRVTNYNIDDLSENEEIVAEVGKYPDEEIEQPATEASSAEYEVLKDGQALEPSLELNNPEAVESHTYAVTAEFNEEEGNVYGIGQYVEGSEVILTAESNPGYIFDGFYLDGNKLTDEDLDNDSSTVQLLITDNVNIQAKFVKNAASPERLEWEKFYVEMDPGDQKQVAVSIYPEDAASADLSYETSDANVVTVEQGLLTAVGPGSATVTVKAYNGITADLIVVVNDPNKPKDITGAKIYLEYDKTTYSGSYNKPWVFAEKGDYFYDEDVEFTPTFKNNKNVGTATVTIKGKDGYTGTASKTFTIVPKGTTISKLAKAKKGFTVKWKRQAAKMSVNRITGYQIRYSLKSNMKSAKTVTVKGYKATSKKIAKLKAKKKYYVQIRTYMKVGKKTYYSAWSKTKSVKTK